MLNEATGISNESKFMVRYFMGCWEKYQIKKKGATDWRKKKGRGREREGRANSKAKKWKKRESNSGEVDTKR